jgi:hypothetical protein
MTTEGPVPPHRLFRCGNRRRAIVEMKDGSLSEGRMAYSRRARFAAEWKSLVDLPQSVRLAIVEVASQDKRMMVGFRPSERWTLRDGEIVEKIKPKVVDPVYGDEEPFRSAPD